MIIKLENFSSFVKENRVFNEDINNLVSELLQTNNLGLIDYVTSDQDSLLSTRHHQNSNEETNEYIHYEVDETNYRNYKFYPRLGPLEFSLASLLLNADLGYTVVILTGALGSGKTSLSNYVLDFIKTSNLPENDALHFPKSGLIYRIDFNELTGDNKEDFSVQFKLELTAQIISIITSIHQNRLFIDDFIKTVKNDTTGRFVLFQAFVRKETRMRLSTEEQKFEYLLEWLDEQDDRNYRLRLVSYLLAYIQETRKEDGRSDFILFLDNIDNFSDDVQLELLGIIFSFSVKLPIKVLLPMRLTTFGKIKGNGSYSFAVFKNRGQYPWIILSKRLLEFLNKKKIYADKTKVNAEYFKLLTYKIEYISNHLLEKNTSRLSNFFSAIAGHSIRRGLYLSERFFVNNAMRYNDTVFYQDEFLRSLLVGENINGKFSTDDALINNVFCSHALGGDNTLLNIRILQILNYFEENNRICKMNVLLSQIGLFDEYTNIEILEAINSLIFFKKRLAYVEGVNQYSDYGNLFQSMHDVIHITLAGIEYLNTLLFDIVYLQHSFIALNWKIPKSMRSLTYIQKFVEDINAQHKNPEINYLNNLIENKSATITDFISPAYDFTDIKDRMKMIRECLYFLLLNDIHQLAVYYENNNIYHADAVENRYIKNSLIIEIIGRVSINVRYILKNNQSNESEIINWHNLLIVTDLWQNQIFKVANSVVANSIKIYEKESKISKNN